MVDPKTKGKMKSRKSKQKPVVPAELLQDERFKDVALDPKFRSIPKSESKIKIDERFGKMFTDKRFKIKATMDKRGRPVNTTSTEDLKRFYHLEENEEDSDSGTSDSEEESESQLRKSKSKSKSKTKPKKGQNNSERRALDDSQRKSDEGSSDDVLSSADELLDFARGEGNVETSEEDSSDSSEDEEEKLMREEAEQEIEWDELDKDAPRSDDISRRLALCNMDWQNLKAEDLFVLMSSFAPANGVVLCVRIFPSEFGKERMQVESRHGPKLNSKNAQALRKYEFERLKYYYAVIECNDENTANAIYESCDGTEFQTSGTKLDLRFIPDEMEFDESEQTDFCDSMPVNYEPVDFVNAALMQSTCESTFDSEDLRRKKTLGKLYSKESKKTQKKKGRKQDDDPLDHMAEHLKTYIASDSDESGEEAAKAAAEKYRKLLLGADDQENGNSSEDSGGDKEITFNPELNAAVEKARKEKDDREKSKKTPFQEYLEKKKQKKRERRLADKAKRKKETTFSDDELPTGVDGDDEFFKQSLSDSEADETKGDADSSKEVDALEKERQEKELELLLMDEQSESQKHFSLKKILKNEKQSKKTKTKRGRSSKEVTATDDDGFKVNVNDPRFSAIYSDHRFNIDPTDASFKRTKAMDAVLAEKTKKRRKT